MSDISSAGHPDRHALWVPETVAGEAGPNCSHPNHSWHPPGSVPRGTGSQVKHQVVKSKKSLIQLSPPSLRQMAISVWCLLLAAPGRGLDLQGAAEVRPQVPGVCPAVQQQPPPEEDGDPWVHPHRDHEDHKVPSPHRAADQDGEGSAGGAAEASKLSLSCQVNPHWCERPGELLFVEVLSNYCTLYRCGKAVAISRSVRYKFKLIQFNCDVASWW